MSGTLLLLLAVTLPLVLSFGLFWRRLRAPAVALAPWTTVPAFILAFAYPGGQPIRIPWLLFGAEFGLDGASRVFLAFTAFLWWCAGVYGQSYFAYSSRKFRFYFFYLLAMSGNLGLIAAGDMGSFYAFFTLMTFSSYGLIVHNGSLKALRAGKVYIVLAILGELLLFAGMTIVAYGAESIYFSDLPPFFASHPSRAIALWLLVIGLGIKAGALPLHVWLPLAHPAAPVPASAVLSGAMIKAGLLGWLKFLPLGVVPLPFMGSTLVVLGLLAAFYAVIVGLTQNKIKTILAYSSISQMGLMTAIVGAGAWTPTAWAGLQGVLLLWALHHALAKSALFLSAGVFSSLYSGWRQRSWVCLGALLPALSLAGAPFTAGALIKGDLKHLLSGAFQGELLLPLAAFLLSLSGVGTFLLLFRFCLLSFRPPVKGASHAALGKRGRWAFGISVLAVLLLPFVLYPGGTVASYPLELATLWPFLAGCVVSVIWMLFRWKCPLHIPEGDLVVVYAELLDRASESVQKGVARLAALKPTLSILLPKVAWHRKIDRFEYLFGMWAIFGVLFAAFFLLLLFLPSADLSNIW